MGGAVQGFSLESGVAIFCAGACVVVAGLALMSLLLLLAERSSGERAASVVIGLLALGLSLGAAGSAMGGFPSLGGFGDLLLRPVAAFGLPSALFQIQASIAALVIAYFAWRFPDR
jgi:hypothetical protein